MCDKDVYDGRMIMVMKQIFPALGVKPGEFMILLRFNRVVQVGREGG